MSEKAEKGNGGIRLKQKLKKELQMLYQPPDPVRKQEFLQRMPESRMSNMEFLEARQDIYANGTGLFQQRY